MYCPQCGNQQTGNEARFCSRCGFQLGVVTALLMNNGLLPSQQANVVIAHGMSKRKKGIRNGAKLMFLSAALAPIFFAIAIGLVDSPAPLIVPFTIFLAGLYWMVYAAIFGDDTVVPPLPNYPQQFGVQPPRTALPGVENFRVTGIAPQRINTSEMVEPPNVTDHTTQLFDKE
jgi:hypothetical protein